MLITEINYFSFNHVIKGTFGNGIRLEYCIKNATSWSIDDRKWPAGSYCILRYDKNCPRGKIVETKIKRIYLTKRFRRIIK